MEKLKSIAVVTGVLGVLFLGGYWLVTWNLRRSLEKADWQGLADLIKAPLGEVVTKTAVTQQVPKISQPSASPNAQAGGWANAKPVDIKRAAHQADTYVAALAVGDAALELCRGGTGLPATSSGLTSLDRRRRLDAWGHPFCLTEVDGRVAVVSPGGSAKASPGCQDLRISRKDLDSLLPGKLYRYPSGTLVLVAAGR